MDNWFGNFTHTDRHTDTVTDREREREREGERERGRERDEHTEDYFNISFFFSAKNTNKTKQKVRAHRTYFLAFNVQCPNLREIYLY